MIRIRKAEEADYGEIMDLIERSLLNECDNGHLPLEKMRDSELFIPELSLVAEIEGHTIVGHVYLIKVSIDDVHPSLGLAQIFIAPEYQKLGFGTLLLYNAHQKARELGYSSVISLGYKRFLSRLGYHTVDKFGITFPYGVVEDQCMALELHHRALAEVQGMVSFPLEYF